MGLRIAQHHTDAARGIKAQPGGGDGGVGGSSGGPPAEGPRGPLTAQSARGGVAPRSYSQAPKRPRHRREARGVRPELATRRASLMASATAGIQGRAAPSTPQAQSPENL